jgi:DNA-binding transcriptional LysR family regulator
LTLEQLRIFVGVAEREHLTNAAAALNLSASAVSSAIRALEERYEAALFHRVGRGIVLTEAGRLLLPQARATLAAAGAAERALSDLGALRHGAVAIAASQTIASYWLPSRLLPFHASYPGLTLTLSAGNTETVADAVLHGAADLGFIEGDIDAPALAERSVDEDHLLVVVGPHHPWADGRRLAVDDLLQSPWVMREPGSGTRSAFESALRGQDFDPGRLDLVLALPSNEAVRLAARGGKFAGVVSELVAADDLGAGRLKLAGFALPPRAFKMLRHKERYLSKAASVLAEMLAHAAEAQRGQASISAPGW